MNKQERVDKVNELIILIGDLDRHFFKSENGRSFFFLENNKLRYVDNYSRKIIKQFLEYKEWKGFSNGGTLKHFIRMLSIFIKNGKPIFEYFEGNYWGYSEESITKIRNKMIEIGLQ